MLLETPESIDQMILGLDLVIDPPSVHSHLSYLRGHELF